MSADTLFDAARLDVLREAIRSHLDELGFELVDLRRAGTPNRPIFQLRVDRPGSTPGHGVTIEDCVRLSRSLGRFLEAKGMLGPDGTTSRYALEVSSPGIGFRDRAGRRASKGRDTETGESDGRID